jgi:hypothetical protein
VFPPDYLRRLARHRHYWDEFRHAFTGASIRSWSESGISVSG